MNCYKHKEISSYMVIQVFAVVQKPPGPLVEAWVSPEHVLFEHQAAKQWHQAYHGQDLQRHYRLTIDSDVVIEETILLIPQSCAKNTLPVKMFQQRTLTIYHYMLLSSYFKISTLVLSLKFSFTISFLSIVLLKSLLSFNIPQFEFQTSKSLQTI